MGFGLKLIEDGDSSNVTGFGNLPFLPLLRLRLHMDFTSCFWFIFNLLSITFIYFCAYSQLYSVHKHKKEVKNKMPRGDKTGPWGLGPKTGRAAGYCAGYDAPGYINPTPGFSRGYGWGFGRGWRRGYGRGFGRGFSRRWRGRMWSYPPRQPFMYPPIQSRSTKQELTALEEYKKELEEERNLIDQEIRELKKEITGSKDKIKSEKE
jgi:hypothetical protein